MKFVIQKDTRTLNQFLQDMEDFKLREITSIKPCEALTIIETK